jgi:tripartite-type tricarboxylate transporter receptor subunit TctC
MNRKMSSRMTCALAKSLRGALASCALASMCAAPSQAASEPAQRMVGDYPYKPIRIIDSFAAGGSTDYMARVLGQKITERFGQPVIVDNRSGAAGNLAAELVAKATPDGYTLLMAVLPALAPSATLYPRLGYDVLKDFAYVTLIAAGTYVVVVNPASPAHSLNELIALAKARPGQISYGSSGVGGPLHLAGELLKSRTGANILHVPYKGAAPVVAAVAGGEVQVGFASLSGALPMIKAQRLTALAVTSARRAKAFPELPTIAESGFPGFDVTPWYGILIPAATPAPIVGALNTELGKVLQAPDIQASFLAQGLEATGSTQERFKAIMQSEIEKWAKVIKDAGIKAE